MASQYIRVRNSSPRGPDTRWSLGWQKHAIKPKFLRYFEHEPQKLAGGLTGSERPAFVDEIAGELADMECAAVEVEGYTPFEFA